MSTITAVSNRPVGAAMAAATVQHPPISRLHPGVLGVTAGAYVAMVLVFWLGFATPNDHYLPLVVFSLVLAAFIGTPLLLAKTGSDFWRRHGGGPAQRFASFRRFLDGTFESGGGNVSGREALILVALVPVALTAGLVAMAFIMRAAM